MHFHFPPIILCISIWPLLAVATEVHDRAGPSESTLAQAYDPATLDLEQRDYLENVADEAAKTPVAVSAVPEAEVPEPQQTASPAAPKTYEWRMDEIKSIVGEAIAAPTREKSQAEQPVTSPRPERRQELRELVRGALSARSDNLSDSYVSKIRQEGEVTVTVTVDEAIAVTAPRQAPDRSTVYTVRPGDSLWSISKHLYGDGYKWIEILRANADRIADENQLVVGQELRIPRL